MPDYTLSAKVTGDASNYEKAMRDAESVTEKFSNTADNLGSKLAGGLAKGFKVAASAIAGVSAALGAGAVAGVKYNATIEQYETSFEVMTGSAEKAAEVVERLKKIGAETPFELPELADATQLLMNYGFTADEAIDRMMMLGDISQGSADKMQRIATAYGQMSSAGKVQLEDIKQMIEAGFNPLQEISESTGESMESLYERISDGSLAVEEITESMQRATSEGGKYFQSMEKQSQTLNGLISTLKDNAQQLLGEVVQPISDSIRTELLPAAIDTVDELSNAFKANGLEGLVKEVGDALSDAVTGVAQAAPDMIDAAVDVIEGFIDGIKKNKNKLLRAGGEIATSLADGIADLLPKEISRPIKKAIDAISDSFTSGGLKKALKTIENLFEGFMDIVSKLAKSVLPLATDALDALGENFDKIAGLIGAATGAMVAYNAAMKAAEIIKTVTGFLEKAKFAFDLFADGVKAAEAIQTAFNIATTAAYAPIFAIVGIIGAVAGGFAAYSLAAGDASEASSQFIDDSNELIEKANETSEALHNLGTTREESMVDIDGEIAGIRDLADQIFELGDKTDKTAEEKELLLQMIDKINEKMPDLELSYDDASDSISLTKDEVYKLIDAFEEQMKTQALMDLTQDAIKERTKAEMELNRVLEQRKKNQAEIDRLDDQIRDAELALGDAYAISTAEGYKAEDQIMQLKRDRDELVETNNTLGASEDTYRESIAKANEEIQFCKDSVNDLATSMDDAGTSAEESGEKIETSASEANEAVEAVSVSAALAYTGTGDAAENMSNRVAGSYRTIQGKSGEMVVFTKGKTDEMNAAHDSVGTSAEQMASDIDYSTTGIMSAYNGTASTAEDYADRTSSAMSRAASDIDYSTTGIMSAYNGTGDAAKDASSTVSSATKEMSDKSGLDLENIAQNCRDMVNSMIIAIIPGMNDFRSTISDGLTGAYTIAKSKFHDMVQVGKMAANDMYGVGQEMANGIASGLNSRSGFLMSTIRGIVNQMVAAAKAEADVNSPSGVTRDELGAPLAQGIGVGFADAFPFAKMRETLSNGISRMSDMVQPINQRVSPAGVAVGTGGAASYQADVSAVFDGMAIQIINNTTVDGTPLKETVSDYTIRKIGNQQRAILRAQGGFA
ncbi:tape measure protein [Zongyangia sp. HA2173]|uniref:tape measure protein n=1 Tax=Zongyangia sp. HA2173 TaxID=3133035 RepID=UPI00315FB4C6